MSIYGRMDKFKLREWIEKSTFIKDPIFDGQIQIQVLSINNLWSDLATNGMDLSMA